MSGADPSSEGRRDFAARLRPLAEAGARAVEGDDAPLVSAFVSRRREKIAAFASPATGLAVVVQGRKHVQCGARGRWYGAGEAVLLDAGWPSGSTAWTRGAGSRTAPPSARRRAPGPRT